MARKFNRINIRFDTDDYVALFEKAQLENTNITALIREGVKLRLKIKPGEYKE